jgi:competence protein CoiA
MQLYALDKSSVISAPEALREFVYLCPECRGPVRKRGGRKRGGNRRQAHFYHVRRPLHCRQHGKSLAHLQIQLHLKSLIPNLILEKRVAGRIADTLWEEEKIVFEVQCSPLSLEEAQDRCQDYTALGYTPVWILHDKEFNGRRLSPAEAFLRRHTPTYFTDGSRIYDQFEVCHQSRRLYASLPLLIDAAHPRRKDLSAGLSFQGDLSDQNLERWQHIEQRILHRNRWRRLKYIYKFLLYRVLELCTF